ncbi:hypothetical protein [Pedobacter sp. MW01-1-1]|uniref:hypothetical protein n=1 Tax=Pedobacter sp. MW01-1-1 TaxID=3383027 RepID=UPI003FEF5768
MPFQKKVKDSIYKLSDEYSLFYLKFIENSRAAGAGTWIKKSTSSSWKSWSGYAFEGIWLKHIDAIKHAMGISGVFTEASAWRSTLKGDGAQIDLLLNRQDMIISVCEMKFSNTEFVIDKTYAAELQQKLTVFKQKSKTKKTVFLVMVTTYGVKSNVYSTGLVQNQVTLEDLFSV